MSENFKKIVLGGGCFWCLDPIYTQIKGVKQVVVGYAGGSKVNPTYEQVCNGNTGHAEVAQITYDENKVSLDSLLDVFFQVHDPTTLNRQGADVGTQYRSIILVNNDEEKEAVLRKIEEINKAKIWNNPLVTQVELLQEFFPAEEYHQNYFKKNPFAGYCQVVINAKLKKFKQKFKDSKLMR
jgi:peptide-methionine (S)-S-oxide reductase